MPWEPLPGRRAADPAPLGASLDRVVRHLGGPSSGAMTELFSRWPELVGATVGENSRPVRVRDGVLVVAVADPAWATQLRFLEATLVDRVRAELGPDAVSSIEVRVRPDALSPGGRDAPDRR